MTDGKLNVLFAASECSPLCKTGGLADVVGAIAKSVVKDFGKIEHHSCRSILYCRRAFAKKRCSSHTLR